MRGNGLKKRGKKSQYIITKRKGIESQSGKSFRMIDVSLQGEELVVAP